MAKHSRKVFGIGFHKTGLTSLGKAFDILGYQTCHRAGPVRESLGDEMMMRYLREKNLEPILKIAENYDAFHDNPWFKLWRLLDEKFPGSQFILTIREEKNWMDSVIRYFGSSHSQLREWIYGQGCPLGHESLYLDTYNRHNSEVLEYFRNMPGQLLVMDLEKGDGWEKLCSFLNKDIPFERFPHLNKSNDSKAFGKRLKRIIKQLASSITHSKSQIYF